MDIYDAKGGHLGSTEDTDIPGALSYLQAQRSISRSERSAATSSRLQMAFLVDRGLSIGRTLQTDGASPDDFKGLPEDNSDSQWLMQKEASLKPESKVILSDRQRVLSDQLRAVSGRRRIEDKQMAH